MIILAIIGFVILCTFICIASIIVGADYEENNGQKRRGH